MLGRRERDRRVAGEGHVPDLLEGGDEGRVVQCRAGAANALQEHGALVAVLEDVREHGR